MLKRKIRVDDYREKKIWQMLKRKIRADDYREKNLADDIEKDLCRCYRERFEQML